eukprot:1360379-Amorphochlora_amoeboformis.AAC.2
MAAGWRPTAWVALAAGIALCFDTKRVSLGVNLRFVPTRQMREVTRVRGGARIAKVKRNATIKVIFHPYVPSLSTSLSLGLLRTTKTYVLDVCRFLRALGSESTFGLTFENACREHAYYL